MKRDPTAINRPNALNSTRWYGGGRHTPLAKFCLNLNTSVVYRWCRSLFTKVQSVKTVDFGQHGRDFERPRCPSTATVSFLATLSTFALLRDEPVVVETSIHSPHPSVRASYFGIDGRVSQHSRTAAFTLLEILLADHVVAFQRLEPRCPRGDQYLWRIRTLDLPSCLLELCKTGHTGEKTSPR